MESSKKRNAKLDLHCYLRYKCTLLIKETETLHMPTIKKACVISINQHISL